MQLFTVTACAVAMILGWSASAGAEAVFEDEGPFRPGEGYGTPATCETIGDWIDRAPDYSGRISMVITGILEESHWDGALAHLIMCKPDQIQVMCVTYSPVEVTDEPVMFAGGYNRAGERQIVLDPCLSYPPE